MFGPTDLLRPSPAPHRKTSDISDLLSDVPSLSAVQCYALIIAL